MISSEQSAESLDATSGDDWEPEYYLGVFHGLLTCARPQCGERVVVLGDWGTQGDDRGNHENSMRLRFAGRRCPWSTRRRRRRVPCWSGWTRPVVWCGRTLGPRPTVFAAA